MGLLSPFSKEARSGLSPNAAKQKEARFPFPGIPRAAWPAQPPGERQAKQLPAAARWEHTTKANYTRKIQCRRLSSSWAQLSFLDVTFPHAGGGSVPVPSCHGRAEDKSPLHS